MVSSLPFLAPVFVRKAKEYRSKHSAGYGGSSGTASHAKANAVEVYAMRSREQKPSSDNSSEENFLPQQRPDNIIKSVSYSVRVEDHRV
jgi:hypothetical protein